MVCQILCMLIVPNTFLRSIYFLLAERSWIRIIFIWSFTVFARRGNTFHFSFLFLLFPLYFLLLFVSSASGKTIDVLLFRRVSPFREPHVGAIIDNR